MALMAPFSFHSSRRINVPSVQVGILPPTLAALSMMKILVALLASISLARLCD